MRGGSVRGLRSRASQISTVQVRWQRATHDMKRKSTLGLRDDDHAKIIARKAAKTC